MRPDLWTRCGPGIHDPLPLRTPVEAVEPGVVPTVDAPGITVSRTSRLLPSSFLFFFFLCCCFFFSSSLLLLLQLCRPTRLPSSPRGPVAALRVSDIGTVNDVEAKELTCAAYDRIVTQLDRTAGHTALARDVGERALRNVVVIQELALGD